MSIKFKIGTRVRQVVHVIEGEVSEPVIVDGEIRYRVTYTGEDGQPHERFFGESEIEAIEGDAA